MTHALPGSGRRAPFRPVHGQTVVVRPAAEILATLDADFTYKGLPFMPEMLKYCGRRMTVHRRAEKTCVEGYGRRKMHDTVLLVGGRCDGAAHDGCQKNCLIFWNEAWLAPADGADAPAVVSDAPPSDDLYRKLAEKTRDGTKYRCQSTQLHQATVPKTGSGLAGLLREIADGELSLVRFVQIVIRELQDRVRSRLGLAPIGAVQGPQGSQSKGDLDLQPGETVEVRSLDEISRTVGPTGRNRGLLFDPNMAVYAGQRHQVAWRIDKMISEETGEMVHLTNTVALKDVCCVGVAAKNCPRAQAHFWREAWLKRVSPPA